MFEKEIEKGVAFLDERMPGWLDNVHPDKLEMRYGSMTESRTHCGCVLAQVGFPFSSNYYELIHSLGIEDIDHQYGFSIHGHQYGFSIHELRASDNWTILTDEWQTKLRELKAERSS